MSSRKDAASRYDKEQADKQRREADEQARAERKRAATREANLEEIAKAERLVQDFLRATRSVGNPGAQYEYPNKWMFKGGKYWSTWGPRVKGYDSLRTHHRIVIQDNELWSYKLGHTDDDFGRYFYEYSSMGRDAEGLYTRAHGMNDRRTLITPSGGSYANLVDSMQRLLVALMRKHGIPIPS